MKISFLKTLAKSSLLAALALFIFGAAAAVPALAKPATGTVRVKLTYVEMNRHDVKALSVLASPLNKRKSDLAALENAARRAHVKYTLKSGPTITAKTGKEEKKDDVEVTPLSVRDGRAYVRIRESMRTQSGRRHVTHIVAATYVYHSGETRRLAGAEITPTKYRYVFATVTVLP